MRLTPGPPQYDFPDLVRVTAPNAAPQDVPVAAGGEVVLTRPVRTHILRLQVLRVRFPIGKANFTAF